MKLSKVVEGTHNKENFRYEKGKLSMFGKAWDKADIKTLIETANLLSVEGYELKTPISTQSKIRRDWMGNAWPVVDKVYEDETDEPEGNK